MRVLTANGDDLTVTDDHSKIAAELAARGHGSGKLHVASAVQKMLGR